MCFFHGHFRFNKPPHEIVQKSNIYESVRTSCSVIWRCKSMRGSNLGLLRSYIAGIDYQPLVLIEGL
jgi:hypothetical protein